MTKRQERKARGEKKVKEYRIKLLEALKDAVDDGGTFDEGLAHAEAVAQSLIKKCPQERSLVQRAANRLIDGIEEFIKSKKEAAA